jgi:cation-transporting P-type ATPase A/B/Cu+-exporting ATPase
VFEESGIALPAELVRWCAEHRGRPLVYAAVDGVACAGFALSDTVKPSAAPAVAELTRLGLHIVLLTGDNAEVAHTVAEQVGIAQVLAEVVPTQKAEAINRMRAQGHSVAMVGDGVNDAPALAHADLGIALVSGAEAALGAANMILLRVELSAVPRAIRLARATLGTIRGNLVWAFGRNVLALPLAAVGLLDPLFAAAAMALSSLLVVSNSMRLRDIT